MLNSKAIVLSEVVAVVTFLVMVSVVRGDPAPHYNTYATAANQFVVYAELGLNFHQILQRQLLWVNGRIALCWVVNAATNQTVI